MITDHETKEAHESASIYFLISLSLSGCSYLLPIT